MLRGASTAAYERSCLANQTGCLLNLSGVEYYFWVTLYYLKWQLAANKLRLVENKRELTSFRAVWRDNITRNLGVCPCGNELQPNLVSSANSTNQGHGGHQGCVTLECIKPHYRLMHRKGYV